MTQDADFEVYDRDRAIRFTGVRLAAASAEAPGKKRWLELELYRTEAGVYLISGAGKSRVPGEKTRRFVHNCATPEGAIDQLHREDDNGTRYLTVIARQLLDEAVLCDDDLRTAYEVEHVA
jgi:hypothetical protein